MDSLLGMNFMLSNDGNTLWAARDTNDGFLQFIATPVATVQNSCDSLQLLKSLNNCLILNEDQLNTIFARDNQCNGDFTSTDLMNLVSQIFQESWPVNTLNSFLPKEGLDNSIISQDELVKLLPKENILDKLQVKIKKKTFVKKNISSSKKSSLENTVKQEKTIETIDRKVECFHCNICKKEFKKQYLLQRHIHEHDHQKPYHCPKCSASFNVPSNFSLHMATHCIGEPKCPKCGQKFARMARLKTHMLKHEVDETLYCAECDDVFESTSQLEAHLKLHDDKWAANEYQRCKHCRKQFTQPLLYRQHLRENYKMQSKCAKQTKHGIRHRTSYKCRICAKVFEKPSQLARHLRVHTGEKPYKCNLCNRSFTQKGTLSIHMWKHNGIRPYSCPFCHAKFSHKGNLKAHVLRMHSSVQGSSPKYRCARCPCVFKRLGCLNGHVRRAHGTEREMGAEPAEPTEPTTTDPRNGEPDDPPPAVEPLERDGDDDDDDDDDTVEAAHQQSADQDGFVVTGEGERTALVTLLDKMSNNKKGRYIRIKQRFVNNSRYYECSFCDKKFKKPSDLIRHLRIHTQEKPFNCKMCDRSFTLKSTMLSHQKTHSNSTKYSCNQCSLFFQSEKAFLSHKNYHSTCHICSLCDQQFPTFDELKSHSMSHTTRKPGRRKNQFTLEVEKLAPKVVLKEPLVLTEASNGLMHAQPKYRNDIAHGKGRPHKCTVCPAAFMKLSHLKQHQRKHTGERPFTCPVCDRTFTTNSALKAHRRIHDLLKPYKCSTCNMNFTTLSSMKRHHFTHSNKRPFMCPYCNKTFKTTVNCRKHMKIHKQEIAQQHLEVQKKQQESSDSTFNNTEMITVIGSDPFDKQDIIFQPVSDSAPISNEQLSEVMIEKEKSFTNTSILPQNICMAEQNISLVNNYPNIGTTHTLHADETGTVVLPNFIGDQTLTPESIKEIEETLNQQLFNIGMNFTFNNNIKTLEAHDNITLDNQDQPILSIIYDNGKTLESSVNSSINTNVLPPQCEPFDLNQMMLQGGNNVNFEVVQTGSENIVNLLPGSFEENQRYTTPLNNSDFEMNNITKHNLQDQNCELVNNCSLIELRVDKATDTVKFSSENNLKCHKCNMDNFNANSLKEHLQTHPADNEYQCSHCFSKFDTSSGLDRHTKIHHVQETHKCYECNQEFSTALQVREHIKEHVKNELVLNSLTGAETIIDDIDLKSNNVDKNKCWKKNNECKYCLKLFRKPSDLIRHIRTHTGERPYQCQYCNKSFAVKCTLDSHLRVHAGEKSFNCHVCNSMFTTKSSLKVHMRLHTGAKPFKCSICDMKFRTSGHLKVHMISHTREQNSSNHKSKKHPTCEQKTSVPDVVINIKDPPEEIIDSTCNDQSLNSLAISTILDQTTLNEDGSILSDPNEFLSLNEDNQLVANLQFLLGNCLVTIHTEDSDSALPTENLLKNNLITTDLSHEVKSKEFQSQEANSQVILSTEIPNEIPALSNDNGMQTNNCMVLQIQNVDSTVPDTNEEMVIEQENFSSYNNAMRLECEICGKAFAKPCQIECHMRIHTEERPYVCQLCDKPFDQESTLLLHYKHHTGDRPHCCPHCDHLFTQSGNLKTHLKHIHKINPVDTKRQSTDQQFFSEDPKLLLMQQDMEDDKLFDFDNMSIVDFLK